MIERRPPVFEESSADYIFREQGFRFLDGFSFDAECFANAFSVLLHKKETRERCSLRDVLFTIADVRNVDQLLAEFARERCCPKWSPVPSFGILFDEGGSPVPGSYLRVGKKIRGPETPSDQPDMREVQRSQVGRFPGDAEYLGSRERCELMCCLRRCFLWSGGSVEGWWWSGHVNLLARPV